MVQMMLNDNSTPNTILGRSNKHSLLFTKQNLHHTIGQKD